MLTRVGAEEKETSCEVRRQLALCTETAVTGTGRGWGAEHDYDLVTPGARHDPEVTRQQQWEQSAEHRT